MPKMSRLQSVLCRSGPWRGVSRNAVLPWALQGFEPRGDVLEIGGGSGAMAAELLTRYDQPMLTVTDFDVAMVDAASQRLAGFGERVALRQADATALPFPDRSFDVVVSFVMLHHTIAWEKVLAESMRVLRPGGHLVGYDLLATWPLRLLHRHDGDRVRLMSWRELRAVTGDLAVDQAILTKGPAGLVVRFQLRR